MAFDYFLLSELRALPEMSDSTTYPDPRCQAAAEYIVGIIERECDTSFIARTVTNELHDGGTEEIVLEKPYALSITSVTESGVAITDNLRVRAGVVTRHATSTAQTKIPFASGVRNIAVTYQAGYSTAVPADLKEAALRATRAYLLETSPNAGVFDRRSSITNELGGTTTLVMPGSDHPTGYPAADAVIVGWREALASSGYA